MGRYLNKKIICLFLYLLPCQGPCAIIGNWEGITLTTDIKKPLFYLMKWELRTYSQENLGEFYIRPALGVNVSNKDTLFLGYDFIQRYIHSQITQTPWQALEYKALSVKYCKILFRSRLEERFRQDESMALRVRERGIFTFTQLLSESISPRAYIEYFFNINHPDWVSQKVLSQQRYFLGFVSPVMNKITTQVGFLYQTHFNTLKTINHSIINLEFYVQMD